jgi:uncharacterized membrane protein YqaE (UPF0057 family)
MLSANGPKMLVFRAQGSILRRSIAGYSQGLQLAGSGTVSGRERATERGFTMDLLRIIIAILLPPLGVFLQVGIGKQFWINILLTLLGYIPGIVHAVWVIAKY